MHPQDQESRPGAILSILISAVIGGSLPFLLLQSAESGWTTIPMLILHAPMLVAIFALGDFFSGLESIQLNLTFPIIGALTYALYAALIVLPKTRKRRCSALRWVLIFHGACVFLGTLFCIWIISIGH